MSVLFEAVFDKIARQFFCWFVIIKNAFGQRLPCCLTSEMKSEDVVK